jgi:hypothetical protein
MSRSLEADLEQAIAALWGYDPDRITADQRDEIRERIREWSE